MSIEEWINKLLSEGKVRKHQTYENTGIVCANLVKVSGTAGTDVNFAYISQYDGIDIVTEHNIHYGSGHFLEDGKIKDNRNRSLFQIV